MKPTRLARDLCRRHGAEPDQGWEPEPHIPIGEISTSPGTHVTSVQLTGWFSSLQEDLARAWSEALRLETLEKEVLLLKQRMQSLEQRQLGTVAIRSLAPEPYQLLKPLEANLRSVEENYVATFYDANLSASGDTPEEAVMNLKDVVIAAYEALAEHEAEYLGPGPARQLAVLSEFMRARS